MSKMKYEKGLYYAGHVNINPINFFRLKLEEAKFQANVKHWAKDRGQTAAQKRLKHNVEKWYNTTKFGVIDEE